MRELFSQATSDAIRNWAQGVPFYIKHGHGVYDVAQHLHWDSEWA